jgi:hypothetical protein
VRLLLALCLLASCATRKHTETHHQAQEQASSETRAASVVESKQQAAAETRTAKQARTRWFRPDGSVRKETVEGELVSQTYRFDSVEARSSSAQVTGNQSKSAASSSTVRSESKPAGFSLPWWAWVLYLVALAAWVVKATGWRPWRR